MTVYIDSSVLLRVIAGEPNALGEWREITRPVSSALTRVECLRTIDRARLRGLPDREVAARRSAVLEQLDAFELIEIDRRILERAAEPFPTAVGSLDGLHLATALLARGSRPDLSLATHDRELGVAARAVGFRVLGVRLARA